MRARVHRGNLILQSRAGRCRMRSSRPLLGNCRRTANIVSIQSLTGSAAGRCAAGRDDVVVAVGARGMGPRRTPFLVLPTLISRQKPRISEGTDGREQTDPVSSSFDQPLRRALGSTRLIARKQPRVSGRRPPDPKSPHSRRIAYQIGLLAATAPHQRRKPDRPQPGPAARNQRRTCCLAHDGQVFNRDTAIKASC